MNVICKLTIFK